MNRMLLWVNILLAAGAVGLAGRIVFTATRPLPEPPQAVVAADEPAPAAGPTRLKPVSAYRAVADRDLFRIGEKDRKARPAVNVDKLTQTRLKLKLWGTIAGDAERASAIIEDPRLREQHLYRIGDTIQNARVKMILRGKVVLTVDGRDEVLVMENQGQEGAPGSRLAVSVPGRAPAPAPAREEPGKLPPAEPEAGDPATRRITLDAASVRQAAENPDDLLKQVRARIHTGNGQPAGLLITGIRPDSVLRKMGLRSGDIVTGMEGEDVTSPEALKAALERLAGDSAVSLRILRQGRVSRLEIQVEQQP